MEINRQNILLSIQRALLGSITTSLRAVTLSWTKKIFHIIFYYNGKISKKDKDLVEEAIGEILIDFEGLPNSIEILRLDLPAKIPCLETFAYYRHE